ncbi:hypothetical protein ACNKHT_28145 [Shigella flexneri]
MLFNSNSLTILFIASVWRGLVELRGEKQIEIKSGAKTSVGCSCWA